ncbi:MAG: ABC transporter ATP-binding protein [Patescibacteria group bacterium]|jgi:ATP-binding cassette subfamily B protein|nr:ABC transporter ATP-binding protein [Patescibacteria group bacterium]MDD5173131.1 ABC transporter ATP-binding protein [Patescibacteria group bacterium]
MIKKKKQTKILLEGFKEIIVHLKKHKRTIIIISFLSLISALANGTAPYFLGRLTDSILDKEKFFFSERIIIPYFLIFLFIWTGVKILADLIDWQNRLKKEKLNYVAYADYIRNSLGAILELPLSFYKNQKSGEVADKVGRAGNWMSRILEIIADLMPQVISFLVGSIICFLIKPVLGLILIIGLIIYILALIKIVKPAAKLQLKGHKAYSKAFSHAYEIILNTPTVKQSGAEEYEKKNFFKNFSLNIVNIWMKVVVIWHKIGFFQRLIINLTRLIIFIISIVYIHQGQMTIGQLLMFFSYSSMIFDPFVRLGYNWQTIQNGLVAVSRVKKILDMPKEKYQPDKKIKLSEIKGEIIFDKVNFSYQDNKELIINNISFKVNPGEVIALVGESGAGKSTLIDFISAYYFPQKGRVLIDGQNIKNIDLRFLRSKIAIVPQEVTLFNDSIKNNIAYGNFGSQEKEIIQAAKQAYAHDFIESFPQKYQQVVGERGVKLSVGQKQRIAIARAILKNPKILILDEPTSALDAKSEKFIQESLQVLMKNRTTFIIAHRLSTVRKADKIFVIDKGKIVEQGNHEDLIKIPNGKYRQLYEFQIGLL